MEEKRRVWCRLSAVLTGTKEEINDLIANGNIGEILKRGSFELDGDGYIPECCVEVYNEGYGESHELGDVDFN